MQRTFLSLLLFCLPLAAQADGMVIPTVAYPANVTIPDQRALIYFTSGTERLVIETRFSGAGTNFAWVVPLPSRPVIEAATPGLFPTLQYLFRPQIIHNPHRYYAGLLALLGIGYLLLFVRGPRRMTWADILACVGVGLAAGLGGNAFQAESCEFVTAVLLGVVFLIRVAEMQAAVIFVLTILGFFLLAGLFLPALSVASRGMSAAVPGEPVSILERKLVGVFDTTIISARDSKSLELWLRENGFSLAPGAGPVIASYVKDGWVFVAAKVRRDRPETEISTPQPLSFTFPTKQPVYPMRLTGLVSQSLKVELYAFGNARASAPHFRVARCTRITIVHPLLRQWVGASAVATKLTATLSPVEMRQDVWLDPTVLFQEKPDRLFSRQGAMTTALNWGMAVFACGLVVACLWAFARETKPSKLAQFIGIAALAGVGLAGLMYLALPKIQVKLVRGGFSHYWREEQLTVRIALEDLDWHSAAEARASLQTFIANPTNGPDYRLKNWDNDFVGGTVREEDSPGNYLLRETNNQLELLMVNQDGSEEISAAWDLSARH